MLIAQMQKIYLNVKALYKSPTCIREWPTNHISSFPSLEGETSVIINIAVHSLCEFPYFSRKLCQNCHLCTDSMTYKMSTQ